VAVVLAARRSETTAGPVISPSGSASTRGAGGAKPKLTFWMFKNYVTIDDDILIKHAKAYAAEKKIDLEIGSASYADQNTKYVQAVETGNTPDIGQLDVANAPRFHGMGRLLDHTDVVKRLIEKNGPLVKAIEPFMRQGRQYIGVPFYSQPWVVFYRKSKLEAKGLRPPETWDELVDTANKINDPPNMYGAGLTVNKCGDGNAFAQMMVWDWGGSVQDASGKKVVLNSPEVLAALKWAQSFYKQPFTPPGVQAWTDPSNNEAFLAGKIAMTGNAASIYWQAESSKNPYFGDTGMALVPAGPKRRVVTPSLFSFNVFNSTKYPELALGLVEYLMQPERFKEYMVNSSGQAAPIYERFTKDPYWQNPNFKALVDAVSQEVQLGYPGPTNPAVSEVSGRWLLPQMFSEVAAGADPQATLSQYQKQVEAIYKTVPTS
jgi:multiple sugar transport system substrate-binding protein